MNLLNNKAFKYKLLTPDELIINLDRLSRFKLPELTFGRVFTDIITKYLISPKYSKEEITSLDYKEVSDIVSEIWNKSVEKNFGKTDTQDIAFETLKFIINKSFINTDENTNKLLKSKLHISPVLNNTEYNNAAINIKFLKKIAENIQDTKDITIENLREIRKKYSLTFPVEKLLIVEGITEEILLPVFADFLHNSFEENGIYISGAGGKSKSPSLYLQLKNRLNIPVILLFDSDAKEICEQLNKQLLKKDKYLLIEKGEFEDIISENLIKRTLNKEYEPATPLLMQDLKISSRMCENIENFYRTRHLGEFKKSKFAKLVAENIKYPTDITEDIKEILSFIF